MILNWHEITRTMNFTEEEARVKIGRRVISRREFSGVPAGTAGRVRGFHIYPSGGCGLDIEWDLPGFRIRPLIDGFSKDEYIQFLKEDVK